MYKEWTPGNNLSHYLEFLWISSEDKVRTIYPDNCTDIIIPLMENRKPVFVGYMTTFLTYSPEPEEQLLGFRLKPGYALGLIKDDMSQFSDKIFDLDTIIGNPFEEIRVKYLESGKIDYNRITEMITQLFSGFSPDPHIQETVEHIRGKKGCVRIEDVVKDVGWGRRMLEKKFKKCLGKTPKRFAQIERFNLAKDNPFAADYYDQSHMIKEFKMLTGNTPSKNQK